MSSKSRKQTSRKGGTPKGQPGAGAPPAGGSSSGHHGVLDIPEAYLKAPKKTHPVKFALMIGLIIFLLVIFIGTDALYSWLGKGKPEIEVLARWNHPNGDQIELTRPDFEQTSRRYSSVFAQIKGNAISPGQTLGLQLGVLEFDNSGINANLDYEELARLQILERLAEDAGIVITRQDLIDHLRPYIQQYGNPEAYRVATSRQGGWGAVYFEDALRRALTVQRYLLVLAESSAMPDPTEVEKSWERDHVETLYDYVEIELASLEEGVRAAVPADEELQTWFDGLEDIERNRYQEPERRRVALVTYRDPESTPATGLLEKYPEPEDAVAEDRASDYYNRVFTERFLIPEDEKPLPAVGEDQATQKAYYSREEVSEQCLREAPIFFALDRWLRDMQTRMDEGAVIDLQAEAAELGLAYEAPEDPLSVTEFSDHAELGGARTASRAFGTEAGSFASTQLIQADFLALLQVTEVVEPAIPPLADIRDEVVDYWVEKELEKQALAKLEAIRDGFEEFVPEVAEDEDDPLAALRNEDEEPHRRASAEAFAAAATTAGLEVRQRDWLDKGGRTEADPDSELPSHRHIKSVVEFEDLEVDEVADGALDSSRERAYLVRLAGSRQVPIDRMSPAEYERYRDQSKRSAPEAFIRRVNTDYLRKEFGLWLFSDDLPESGEKEEGADGNAPTDDPPADDSQNG